MYLAETSAAFMISAIGRSPEDVLRNPDTISRRRAAWQAATPLILSVSQVASRAVGGIGLLVRAADHICGEPALTNYGVDLQVASRTVLVHPDI